MATKCIECNLSLTEKQVEEHRVIHPKCHKTIMKAIFAEQKSLGLTRTDLGGRIKI